MKCKKNYVITITYRVHRLLVVLPLSPFFLTVCECYLGVMIKKPLCGANIMDGFLRQTETFVFGTAGWLDYLKRGFLLGMSIDYHLYIRLFSFLFSPMPTTYHVNYLGMQVGRYRSTYYEICMYVPFVLNALTLTPRSESRDVLPKYLRTAKAQNQTSP